jgi:hypothetical protein
MANREKTNIRLKKVYQRLLKDRNSENPIFRKLLKKNEEAGGLTRWIDYLWKTMYDEGFAQSRGDKKWEPQISQIFKLVDSREKIWKSIYRLEAKHKVTLEQAQHEHYLLNAGLMSQSY